MITNWVPPSRPRNDDTHASVGSIKMLRGGNAGTYGFGLSVDMRACDGSHDGIPWFLMEHVRALLKGDLQPSAMPTCHVCQTLIVSALCIRTAEKPEDVADLHGGTLP